MWAEESLHMAFIQKYTACFPLWIWNLSWEIYQACERETSPKWARESNEKQQRKKANHVRVWSIFSITMCCSHLWEFLAHPEREESKVCFVIQHEGSSKNFRDIVSCTFSPGHNHLWEIKYSWPKTCLSFEILPRSLKSFSPITRQIYEMYLVMWNRKLLSNYTPKKHFYFLIGQIFSLDNI